MKIKLFDKHFLFIYLIVLNFGKCISQNLTINPSFKDTFSCPNNVGQIDQINNWWISEGSPDYFNACALPCGGPSPCVGIPLNAFGFQFPFDGNAYVGISTYFEGPFFFREFISTRLSEPLSIGKRYFVSAYISRANSTIATMGYNAYGATNNFGFKFSLDSFSLSNPCPTNNFSHAQATSIITDSINWTKISGSFIADTAFIYLTLGNFYDNQHTDTMDIGQHPVFFNHAYYYIDLVCVTQDSLNCNPINSVNSIYFNENIKIFPNSFENVLNINCDSKNKLEIVIYDLFSRKMISEYFYSFLSISTSNLESGVYLYKINDIDKVIKVGKIIKQ